MTGSTSQPFPKVAVDDPSPLNSNFMHETLAEAAVCELLEAADPMPARLRAVAVDAARMTGRDGLPGWAAIARAVVFTPHASQRRTIQSGHS
jgi:hypothetical protein